MENESIIIGWGAGGGPVHLSDVRKSPFRTWIDLKQLTPEGVEILAVLKFYAPDVFNLPRTDR